MKKKLRIAPLPEKSGFAVILAILIDKIRKNWHYSNMLHHVTYKKFAFTLAEVLITLGIIGVVAALVLPSAINGYQKRVYATKVKYAYTIFSNAFIMAEQEHGDPTEWDWDNINYSFDGTKHMVETYILPYVNVVETSSYGNNMVAQIKNGTTFMFFLDGCISDSCEPKVINSLYIIGSTKGIVSTMGDERRDYSRSDFIMQFSKTNKKLIFFNWGGSKREEIKNNSIYACNKNTEDTIAEPFFKWMVGK